MKLKKIIAHLKEVRKTATMENAGFNPSFDSIIKEETKIWRDTWLIIPLDEIIKELEK